MSRLFSLGMGAAVCLFSQASMPVKPGDVITHLERTIAWYHDVVSVTDSTSTDVLQRDGVREEALNGVRLAFEFARAESNLAAGQAAGMETNPPAQAAPEQNLQAAATRANDRVNSIQSEIQEINAGLGKSTARARDTLIAKRNELEAELKLAKEVQSTVQNLVQFAGAQESGAGPAGTLTAEINQLQRSVPELMPRQPTSGALAARSTVPAAQQPFHPESAGIIALAGQVFTVARNRSQLTGISSVEPMS